MKLLDYGNFFTVVRDAFLEEIRKFDKIGGWNQDNSFGNIKFYFGEKKTIELFAKDIDATDIKVFLNEDIELFITELTSTSTSSNTNESFIINKSDKQELYIINDKIRKLDNQNIIGFDNLKKKIKEIVELALEEN